MSILNLVSSVIICKRDLHDKLYQNKLVEIIKFLNVINSNGI